MIKSVRADRPAALFQFSDGVMQFYFDMHEGARPEEAHQYVNAPDVFCLEQQEQPLFQQPAVGEGEAAESHEKGEDEAIEIDGIRVSARLSQL